ncbi:molybdate ABC transporter substrate-binding protein [Campylobacter canadensis]|uniref:molybdate ABC transporter substrate-binding protein n=1 Tax=Campylobacter canadensis TaxID=449520 RepID=UPI001552A673|nr:molybdate ABC transporter substrate-binding protein [Campylobacter canadensis]MBZ7994690.1 molybdate ABC transporter substrate-binding protein [Campylobacter canadensis]MBZ7996186.1 molybdate ABC transporter substrate-binding protein [Campylobacter canadensis]MBZ7999998.1 molybdate ABC transporter substrate-binding protein [Campylobacter canadensis]MBZ8001617.1 molybdate ABC transporter substrate-binding protein [Campylobacter canadensis]MBZ8003289.1 molybdate ABC transporter substrate-bind
MKKILLSVVFCAFALAQELSVAAAANISYPLEDIKNAFLKHYPDVKIQVNTGSSGTFNSQIKNGAKFDIFLSANSDFAKDLEGLTKNKASIYTQGLLMLFAPNKKASLNDLKNAKCIAVANPKSAPYGAAAIEVLKKLNFDYTKSVIYASSIANTLSQTLSACEYGFIAASSKKQLLKMGYKDENMLIVDEKLYTPILQSMIVISDNKSAKDFYDFILSKEAKAIFKEYGYK